MTLGEFRALTANCADDWTFTFKEPNFPGPWHEEMDRGDVEIEPRNKLVMVRPPLWEPCS